MCGIAGILELFRLINQEELDRFTDALTHRGPDGRGTFVDGKLGLGHRRLSILDLSDAGQCPMSYGGEDGKRYWITYNGEVYNFLELREELQKLGHKFKTQTDTEVIIASYEQWGEKCLLKFNGMWAFAIWDTREKRLFIARDRFGIKPLYYMNNGNKFAFASELKAFHEIEGFRRKLNSDIVPSILKSSYSYEGSTDQTLFSSVMRLPAGHCMTIREDGHTYIRKWWETMDHVYSVPSNYEDQVQRFKELFIDSVRIRMRSDVSIGTSLSGGLDSSSVACSMFYNHQKGNIDLERCPDDWQKTFIATFPGTKLDEREYADEVVRAVGAKPHYWTSTNEGIVENLVNTVWSMEDVYGGLMTPVWSTYREMRRNNIYVTIDGHGGDELLCGYGWYLNFLMRDVNKYLYSDFHKTLLPSILRNYDRCSMAHGVEVRMPFMDYRLVTFAFSLPAVSKIGGGFTKRILRDSMNGILPEKIRKRISKIGFNSPMIELFNGGMANFIENVFSHPLFLDSPFWIGDKIREEVIGKTRSKSWTLDDWGLSLNVWTIINVVLWHLLFIEKNRQEVENMI